MTLLGKLGYNINCKGVYYFVDLIDDVRNALKEYDDINFIKKEMLPRYYLEGYHFAFEVGKYRYFEELDKFCNSRVITRKNKKINREIMNCKNNMNVHDTLIFIAKYYNNLEEKDNSFKVLSLQKK
jgi:hypothetical protein